MPTVKDVYNLIDSFAPFDAAEEWDNPGLLAGNPGQKVTKAVFALDATSQIIESAAESGAQLIVTHHPVIFKPVSSVLKDSLVYSLIENGLSVICAHTNFDFANGGVNDTLCEKLGLSGFYRQPGSLFNIAEFKEGISPEEFVKGIKKSLGADVRYNKNGKTIYKAAVLCGGGAGYLEEAHNLGCDALVTGDAGHHHFLDADVYGMTLAAAGHFETEFPAVEILASLVEKNFEDIECIRADQKSPVCLM